MKKAIVLGCRDVGLGVIRSLAAKNIKTMAIPTEFYDFAHFSRFVAAKTGMMSPDKEGVKLLDFLLNLDESWDGALILPTNDPAVVFIARNRKPLSSRFMPAAQELETISKIIDKSRLYQQAQNIGIPMPAVFPSETVEALMQKKDRLTYPCILKPYETHKFFPVFNKKSLVITDFSELVSKFEMVRANNLNVMISEIIPGADDCIFNYVSYTDRAGDIAAEICMQKIRQHPPGLGMARVAKTIPVIQEIRNLSLKLLKSFSYHGFSSVEFKFDRRDRLYKLMEINVRPELQERLFFAAGVNFPYIAFTDQTEGAGYVPHAYKTEIYWIDIIRDMHAFIKCRKMENWTCRDYLRPYLNKKVFCTPFFDDPAPFVVKVSILAKHNIKKFFLRDTSKKTLFSYRNR
jgi:D-aspartate ligase